MVDTISVSESLTKERLLHESKYNGVGSNDRGLNIQLYSGKPFYPEDPREEDIDIRDIARSLSMLCRFGGHINNFYSVAQHSVELSYIVEPKNAFCALMHDSTEAYYGDMIRPLKYLFPRFIEMEDNCWKVIAKKYGLPQKMPDDVKNNDTRICFTEKRDLLPASNGTNWGYEMSPHENKIVAHPPEVAERMFINRFEELYKG